VRQDSGVANPSAGTLKVTKVATLSAKVRKRREKRKRTSRETERRMMAHRLGLSFIGKRRASGCDCLPLMRPGAGIYICESETVIDKYSASNGGLEGGK